MGAAGLLPLGGEGSLPPPVDLFDSWEVPKRMMPGDSPGFPLPFHSYPTRLILAGAGKISRHGGDFSWRNFCCRATNIG